MLDPEKSQWEVTATSDLQIFMSLVGVRALILDPKKSQREVTLASGSSSRCATFEHVVLQATFPSDNHMLQAKGGSLWVREG